MSDGKLIIETELGTKSFDAQYKELETKLKADQKRLNELMKIKASGGDLNYGTLNSEIAQLQSNVERTSNKMLDLRLKVKEAGDESKDTANKFDANFKKMGNTVKKFAYSLIGLRSIYAVVSRASSAYLSQDTELAEKLKSVWVGLGSFLAPVLEFISNSLLKALGYLNVFIKALTGIDFLARANAKALKAQASAQKELNNQTYDFDVIRKQQDNSSSGGGGIDGGDLFQIPELDEKVVKKLQDLAKWLKENEKLVKALGTALLIAFGASVIGKIIKNLGGLNGALGTLASIGIIAIGVSLLYTAMTGRDLIEDLKNIKIGIQELKKETEKNTEAEKKHMNALEELNNKMIENIETGNATTEQIDITKKHLEGQTTAIENQIKNLEVQQSKTEEMQLQEKELSKELESNIEVYDSLYKQNLLNDEETDKYLNTILDLIVVKQRLGENTDDLKKKYDELRIQTGKDKDENYRLKDSAQAVEDKYKELTGKAWRVKLNSDTSGVEYAINNIKYKLSDLVNRTYTLNIRAVENFMRNTGYTGYATGGIVTQPTRALIGEAGYPEAVVPMTQDYLSTLASEIARFGGSNGGGTVNVYLDGRLIQRQVSNTQAQRNFATNR